VVIFDRISRIDGTEDGGNTVMGITCKSSNTPINITSLLAAGHKTAILVTTCLSYKD
jgi:hypothetical protein